jgi:hypothetical protein
MYDYSAEMCPLRNFIYGQIIDQIDDILEACLKAS